MILVRTNLWPSPPKGTPPPAQYNVNCVAGILQESPPHWWLLWTLSLKLASMPWGSPVKRLAAQRGLGGDLSDVDEAAASRIGVFGCGGGRHATWHSMLDYLYCKGVSEEPGGRKYGPACGCMPVAVTWSGVGVMLSFKYTRYNVQGESDQELWQS